MANDPTRIQFPTSQLGRVAEVSGADWTGGMNPASQCHPVGVSSDVVTTAESWTLNDQTGSARTPQQTQAIGLEAVDVLYDRGADVNDRAHYVQAAGAVAPGGDIGGGVLNDTSVTLQSGDLVWGRLPVA